MWNLSSSIENGNKAQNLLRRGSDLPSLLKSSPFLAGGWKHAEHYMSSTCIFSFFCMDFLNFARLSDHGVILMGFNLIYRDLKTVTDLLDSRT